MKNKKSLHRWLVGYIVTGAAVMILAIIAVSMTLYMRSVRRIYKAEMLRSAQTFLAETGRGRVNDLLDDSSGGKAAASADITDIEASLRMVADEEGLSDLSIYSFDEESMTAGLIACAYPDREKKAEDLQILFTRQHLQKLTKNAFFLDYDKDIDNRWEGSAFYPLVDETGKITGFVRASISTEDTLDARIRFFKYYAPICILLIILFAAVTSLAVKKKIVYPLSELNEAALAYGKQDAEAIAESDVHVFNVPEDITQDEIGTLWNTFSDMENSIGDSVKSLKSATAEIERKEAEVSVASQIQLGMLPASDPAYTDRDDFSLCGSMTPAKGVGGDFYDYFFIDDDHLALIVGDVSGKGIPAALFMMMSMTQLRTQSAGRLSPAEIMREANNIICRSNPEMMFVTVWFGIAELSTGTLRECNAGHEYPAVFANGQNYVLDEADHDMPVGLMEGIEFTETNRKLRKGDRIFVYSDGLPEAVNEAEEQYGTDRMIDALNMGKELSDEELLKVLKEKVMSYSGDAGQFDDLTMLSFTFGKWGKIMEVKINQNAAQQFTEILQNRELSTPLERQKQMEEAYRLFNEQSLKRRDTMRKVEGQKSLYLEKNENAPRIEEALGNYRIYDEDSLLWVSCDDTLFEFLLSRDEAAGEDQQELLRTFKLLASLGPAGAYEEDGKTLTKKSFDAIQNGYMQDLEITYDTKMEEMRQLLNEGVNLDIFSKNTVQQNPEYAARELNRIRVLAKLFEHGTPAYQALDQASQQNADAMMHAYELCQEAYNASVYKEDRLSQLAVERIRSEAKYPATVKTDIDAFFLQLNQSNLLQEENAAARQKYDYVKTDITDENCLKYVGDIKKAVEENPAHYEKSKAEIDKMVKELMVCLETVSINRNVIKMLDVVGGKYVFESDPQMKAAYQNLTAKLGDKGTAIFGDYAFDFIKDSRHNAESVYASSLYASVMYRLTGKEKLTLNEVEMVRGLGVMDDVYDEVLEEKALEYAETMRQKNPDMTFTDLLPESQLAIKRKTDAFVDKLKDYDTHFIISGDAPKEIIKKRKEIKKLCAEEEKLAPFLDMKLTKESSLTISGLYLTCTENTKNDDEITDTQRSGFNLKREYIKAAKNYLDDPTHRKKACQTLKDSIEKLDMDTYDMWNELNHPPVAQSDGYPSHPAWQGVRAAEADLKKFAADHPELKKPDFHDYGSYYEKELKKLLEVKPKSEEEEAKVRALQKEYSHKLKWARLYLGAHAETFHYAGRPDSRPLGNPALVRSFNMELDMPVFLNMEPEDYINNLADISAHVFFHEPGAEELEEAKRRQKAGIRRHMECYAQHFEMLLDKYGLGPASLSYVISNFQQIRRETNCVQDGANLIIKDEVELDKTNENDLRIWHLANYFNGFGTYLIQLGAAPVQNMPKDNLEERFNSIVMVLCKESYEYLKSHPRAVQPAVNLERPAFTNQEAKEKLDEVVNSFEPRCEDEQERALDAVTSSVKYYRKIENEIRRTGDNYTFKYVEQHFPPVEFKGFSLVKHRRRMLDKDGLFDRYKREFRIYETNPAEAWKLVESASFDAGLFSEKAICEDPEKVHKLVTENRFLADIFAEGTAAYMGLDLQQKYRLEQFLRVKESCEKAYRVTCFKMGIRYDDNGHLIGITDPENDPRDKMLIKEAWEYKEKDVLKDIETLSLLSQNDNAQKYEEALSRLDTHYQTTDFCKAQREFDTLTRTSEMEGAMDLSEADIVFNAERQVTYLDDIQKLILSAPNEYAANKALADTMIKDLLGCLELWSQTKQRLMRVNALLVGMGNNVGDCSLSKNEKALLKSQLLLEEKNLPDLKRFLDFDYYRCAGSVYYEGDRAAGIKAGLTYLLVDKPKNAQLKDPKAAVLPAKRWYIYLKDYNLGLPNPMEGNNAV